MKEKIEQLEKLLNEINSNIETTFQIRSNTIPELRQFVDDLKNIPSNEDAEQEKVDFDYQRILDSYIRIKEDQTLIHEDLPRFKALLNTALSNLSKLNNGSFSETKFGTKLKRPNVEFLELLHQNILTVESRIYATYNHIKYNGQLTSVGYFTLWASNEFKPFSSLSTAASFVCKKPNQKGWEFWYSHDKDGNEKNMQYFRNLIK